MTTPDGRRDGVPNSGRGGRLSTAMALQLPATAARTGTAGTRCGPCIRRAGGVELPLRKTSLSFPEIFKTTGVRSVGSRHGPSGTACARGRRSSWATRRPWPMGTESDGPAQHVALSNTSEGLPTRARRLTPVLQVQGSGTGSCGCSVGWWVKPSPGLISGDTGGGARRCFVGADAAPTDAAMFHKVRKVAPQGRRCTTCLCADRLLFPFTVFMNFHNTSGQHHPACSLPAFWFGDTEPARVGGSCLATAPTAILKSGRRLRRAHVPLWRPIWYQDGDGLLNLMRHNWRHGPHDTSLARSQRIFLTFLCSWAAS